MRTPRPIWTGPAAGDPKPIIYLGGNPHKYGGAQNDELLDILRFTCLSYFELGQPGKADVLQKLKKHRVRAFLDSGAFSYQMQALKQKRSIDKKEAARIIDAYAAWVLGQPYVFDFIVTFDYIRDAEVVLWATARLEERGLNPVPVYHIGTPLQSLRKLIDQGYSLIGIGGLAGSTDSAHPPTPTSRARPFLDQVFNLTEKHGTRLHGFGIGGHLIACYPWFSVDSTSWLHYSRRGIINEASRDPRRLFRTVPVSSRISAVKNEAFDESNQPWAQWAVHNIKFWSGLNGCTPPPLRKGLF